MNDVIYAVVYVVIQILNGKPKKFTNWRVNKKPRWKERTENKINELRGKVSIPNELITRVKVKSGILNRIEKKYRMKKLDDFTPLERDSKTKDSIESPKYETYEKRTKF